MSKEEIDLVRTRMAPQLTFCFYFYKNKTFWPPRHWFCVYETKRRCVQGLRLFIVY